MTKDIKKPTLAENQDFWAEQLPLFKEAYWLPEHFELLKFDMEAGNFVVRDDIDQDFKDDADDLYHRINTGWSMWKRAVNHMQKKLEGCVVVPINNTIIVAIEKMVEQQVEASGITADVFRLDGEKILNAAVEAARAEMSNQLKPCEVVRNRFGCWVHPVYLKYLNDHFADTEYLSREDWNELKRHFNIVTTTMHLESCVSADEYDEIMDGCDLSRWTPPIPHGFFLIDIGFTEDGAEAIFAKELKADAEG